MYYEDVNTNYDVPVLRTHYFSDIPFTDGDIYLTVDQNYENRLDKVAYAYYNNVKLWWVIAQASDIKNPLYVPVGTILRIPPFTTLFHIRGLDM